MYTIYCEMKSSLGRKSVLVRKKWWQSVYHVQFTGDREKEGRYVTKNNRRQILEQMDRRYRDLNPTRWNLVTLGTFWCRIRENLCSVQLFKAWTVSSLLLDNELCGLKKAAGHVPEKCSVGRIYYILFCNSEDLYNASFSKSWDLGFNQTRLYKSISLRGDEFLESVSVNDDSLNISHVWLYLKKIVFSKSQLLSNHEIRVLNTFFVYVG